AGKAAEPEVFGDRQLGHELEFLVDDDDTGLEGIPHGAVMLRLAVDENLADVGGLVAGKHADEGGFACAVFAHQAMYGALLYAEGNVGERLHAGISLGYRPEFEKVRHVSTPKEARRLCRRRAEVILRG